MADTRAAIAKKYAEKRAPLLKERDRIQKEILPDQILMDSLLTKVAYVQSLTDSIAANKNNLEKDIYNVWHDFPLTGVNFNWISFGGGFKNNNFKLFNPAFQSLDSQLIKKSAWAASFSLEYNYYHWKNPAIRPAFTWYLGVGVKATYSDNYADLDEIELTDTRQYGDSLHQRTKSSKIIAYEGDYQNALLGAKTYADFYAFFWKNNAGLHVFPDVNFRQHKHPIYNTGIGILYSFKDAKDKENKARVNIEVYFRLLDLTDQRRAATDEPKPFYQRNDLGLRLSLPFNFFNIN